MKKWVHWSRFFFSKEKKTYSLLYDKLGFYPKNTSLYKLALTHRSVSSKDGGLTGNNERLELLGDAVIELVVSDYLYHKFSEKDEGYLTQLRSQLVGRTHLSYLAKQINLDQLVLASLHNQPAKNVLGNALEALIGAIYLDLGYNLAQQIFLHRILLPYTDMDKLVRLEFGYKGKLLELVQKHAWHAYFDTFEKPSLIKTMSKDVLFYCFLRVNGVAYGSGIGSSKKIAEEQAAREAYNKLKQSLKQ